MGNLNSQQSASLDPKWWHRTAERPLGALCNRVLLIGLDGATFDILRPMMDQGRMPNLKGMIERGASGVLMSTIPPITPAAWTTFMTGKGPGKHGIFDFERYNVRTNELTFNSTYLVRDRTIWQILGDAGLRVGSLLVPMTYPPKPVNGFLVSGFGTPGTDTEFTHPSDLKADILDRWPAFTFKTKWNHNASRDLGVFRSNIDAIKQSFTGGVELARHCGEKYGWDVMMVLYKLVDNLQHKTWKYLDPKTAGRDPARAELAADCFNHLDRCVGDLIEYAESRDASMMIMSDHGHGSLDGKVQPNLLLRQWGYLGVNRARQIKTRASGIVNRWLSGGSGKFSRNRSIEDDLAIDWPTTRAFVAHAGMCGFLYINLKGRQATGIVDPADYDRLRKEIAEKLLSVTVPDANGLEIAPFEAVHEPETLYGCDREQYEWLPDLLLVPRPGLAVVRKIRSRQPVMWSSFRKLEGTHRMEGIFIAAGKHIRHQENVAAQMADIAPTLLSAVGLRIPADMDGRVISEIFDESPCVEFEDAESPTAVQTQDEVYNEREQAILTERLADLGYLE